jgi:predicted nucleic acid-binding protein
MRYFDTGVLLKLYLPEPNSAQAMELIAAVDAKIPLTSLHRLEIVAVFANHVGRGAISEEDRQKLLADFEADVAGGVFDETSVDWRTVFARAEMLAQTHGTGTLCRSLDILHVALSQELESTEFCTLDRRQAEMAKAVGMTVIP